MSKKKEINMDNVVNAIEKLEAINGEPEYIVLKKQIASLQKELTIFKDAMKQKLKFKMTRWGLVVPSDTILKQWQKENLLLEEVYKNKTTQVEIDSTIVFSGLKLNKRNV